ncbi:MAG TPA: GDSL-type esterase/lipase family protein, partial [Planctomycetota bacterium]|nr:GDSL-type esterase/lipase family protein [Planctomycetota bacterium]
AVVDGELFLNGESVGRGGASDVGARLTLGAPPFRGLLDQVQAGERLDPAALAEALPWYRPRPHRREPFPAGRFVLEPGDTVALLGGENMVGLGEAGHLETTLLLAGPKELRLRSLAWEGDTVFEQRRDLNFGPWSRYLERSGATVLFVQFGAMEALRGGGDFVASYDRLLGQLRERTKRVVVLSPTRFEKKPPPLPDLSARNADLAKIVEACRATARAHDCLFVDLSGLELPTRDGVHLTDDGQKAVAREIARQLGIVEPPTETAAVETLRSAVREKNRLWFDHWRPMNWAFLEGDRTEQASSRDHVDRALRWFPLEIQDFLPLIRDAETRIEKARAR